MSSFPLSGKDQPRSSQLGLFYCRKFLRRQALTEEHAEVVSGPNRTADALAAKNSASDDDAFNFERCRSSGGKWSWAIY